MLAADCLAKRVLDYLSLRTGAEDVTRIMLTGLPDGLLRETCCSLVTNSLSSESGSRRILGTAGEAVFEVAMMQEAADAGSDSLVVCDDYKIGSTWDHLVGLRNRRVSLVAAIPNSLMDSCPESLKTNTFQDFNRNAKFGSELGLLHSVSEAILSGVEMGGPDPRMLAEALRTQRSLARGQFGDRGDEAFFDQLERLAKSPESAAGFDLRLLGILPDSRLQRLLQTSREPDRVAKLVKSDFAWQASFVGGLAQNQRKYLADQFGARDDFERLELFVAKRGFRLELDDPSWRWDWPADLLLDDLGARQRNLRNTVRVSSLHVTPVHTMVLGLSLTDNPVELVWRLGGSHATVPGRLSLDDVQTPAETDLINGRFEFDEDLSPGLHRVVLASADPDKQLSGQTEAAFVVEGADLGIVASINEEMAGRRSYQVESGIPLVVKWEALPGSAAPDSAFVYVASPSGGLQPIDASAGWVELAGGIDEPTEITVTGRFTATGQTVEAMLEVVPLRSADSDEIIAENVGRALLKAVGTLKPVDVQRPSFAFELRKADEVLEIILSEHNEVGAGGQIEVLPARIQDNELLTAMERSFLGSRGDLWPRVMNVARDGQRTTWTSSPIDPSTAAAWEGHFDAAALIAFRQARARLFATLSASGVSRTALSRCTEDVRLYAEAYLSLLAQVTSSGSNVGEALIALTLTGSVVVPRRLMTLTSGWKATGEAPVAAILVGPTHPLRLAWLAALECKVIELLEQTMPWSPTSMESLEAVAYPSCLLDWSFTHYHSTSLLSSDSWSLLLPEGEEGLDELLPSDLVRRLGASAQTGKLPSGPREIARTIRDYQDLHPYRNRVRIGFLNPGSGEGLLEALELLIHGKVKPSVELAQSKAAEMKYQVALLQGAESMAARTGLAFEEYVDSREADPDVLSRVVFSRDAGSVPLLSAPSVDAPEHHVLFGTSVVAVRGKNVRVAERANSPEFGGLLLRQRRTFEADNQLEVVNQTLVSPPDYGWNGLTPPAEAELDQLIHGLLFAIQSVSACTAESPYCDGRFGRALVATITPSSADQIGQMHRVAEWVCMMDSHIDVEYFDDPALEEHYVISYVPKFVAQAERDSRSPAFVGSESSTGYVVTASSEYNAPIRAAINRFLHSAYGQVVDESAAPRLASAVNRVNGRLLLRLAGEPAAAKGATGMGLTQLAYESLELRGGDLTEAGFQGFRLLIPIDDYAGSWFQSYKRHVGPGVTAEHADLLDVLIDMTSERPTLMFQVIEVKNHKIGGTSSTLEEGAARQVVGTGRVIEALFGVGSDHRRADSALKDWELAELLDFHLRRTTRQMWGADREKLEHCSVIRSKLRRAITRGNYQSSWRAGEGNVGVVIHFDRDLDAVADTVDARAKRIRVATHGDDDRASDYGVLYVSIALPEILALLSGEDMAASGQSIRTLLDPCFELPPSVGAAVSPRNGGEATVLDLQRTAESGIGVGPLPMPTRLLMASLETKRR